LKGRREAPLFAFHAFRFFRSHSYYFTCRYHKPDLGKYVISVGDNRIGLPKNLDVRKPQTLDLE
jgi:hypothetical protein